MDEIGMKALVNGRPLGSVHPGIPGRSVIILPLAWGERKHLQVGQIHYFIE
jgi:hypothetical protein